MELKELTPEEKWEKATLANNFIFYKIMHNNPDVCKELLEILLDIEIDHIKMGQEEVFQLDPFSKGIRLDVYAKNENTSFDLEIQATDTKELNKRARYYQGVMDVDNLASGSPYSSLKDSYVIFICLDDIFEKGLPIYTFENICKQDTAITLNDRAYKYFFSGRICAKLLKGKQRAFFNLLINNKGEDSYTNRLSNLIFEAKKNVQWRMQYMEFERQLAYERETGIEQGRNEKALEDALILIKDFNITPEVAAEKLKVPLEVVLKNLKENAE